MGVFSLSLMGTNFPDFLLEANRVMKKNGVLFVAEVLSRFTDVDVFVNHMKNDVGFKLLKINKLKDFFYIMVFEKEKDAKKSFITKEFYETLKPCKYKKR